MQSWRNKVACKVLSVLFYKQNTTKLQVCKNKILHAEKESKSILQKEHKMQFYISQPYVRSVL